MLVKGNNVREDFHLSKGSELFYQIKDDIELVVVSKYDLVLFCNILSMF